MKDLGREVSIKVGIIGSRAYEKHPDSDLTNAELGAVHEFGVTINVTEKMRNYLHSQGIHLKKDTTTVVIPTRSFLRMPLMSREGIKELTNVVIGHTDVGTGGKKRAKGRALPVRARTSLTKVDAGDKKKLLDCVTPCAFENKIMDNTAHLVAEAAYSQVLKALENGGNGKWAPISEFTRQRRKGNPSTPPLTDTGDLRKSISYEIKCKNYAKT